MNFSRVDPGLLEVDNERIRLVGTSTFCQGIMLGACTDSNIISSVVVGSPNNQYQQHRLTIAPFVQEMRRETSVWGKLLNFSVIMATTSHKGFSFISRGEGKSGYTTPCEHILPLYSFRVSSNVVFKFFSFWCRSIRIFCGCIVQH